MTSNVFLEGYRIVSIQLQQATRIRKLQLPVRLDLTDSSKFLTVKMKKVTHQNFICDLIVLRYPQPTLATIVIGIELRIRIVKACVGNKSTVYDT